MTTAEIAGVLAKAQWPESTSSAIEGFRVMPEKGCILVSFRSPLPHANTTTRMLRNYEKALEGYEVTRLKSHLIVTGKR